MAWTWDSSGCSPTVAFPTAIGIGVAASVVGAVAGQVWARWQKQRNRKASRAIELKIAHHISEVGEVATTLQRTTALLAEIEEAMQDRQKLARELQHQIDRDEKLAGLTKQQSEAVVGTVQKIIRREGKRTFFRTVLINFVYFLAGAVTTFIIAILVRKPT